MAEPIVSAVASTATVIALVVVTLVSAAVGAFREWRARRNDKQVSAHRAMGRGMHAASRSGLLDERDYAQRRDEFNAACRESDGLPPWRDVQ